MPTDFRLHIDPADVLGVSREATLQEIRDAYRAKAKRYHPDAGGEEWTFRILAQAYEILSTARVASATDREANAPPRRTPPPHAAGPTPPPFREPGARPFSTTPPPRAEPRPRADTHESVRPGVREAAVDPSQVVDVEKMSIRYEAEHVWLITDRSREDRFLSCCLNVTWPDPELPGEPGAIPNAEVILKGLNAAFNSLGVQTRPISLRSSVEDGRFSGWVSYPSDNRAQDGFNKFRDLLHGVGLVVKQWSRDLVIPRQWR